MAAHSWASGKSAHSMRVAPATITTAASTPRQPPRRTRMTVSATRYPRLRSIPKLYWVRARGGFARLPKRREHGLRRQALLEGDDTSLDGLGERLGGRAEPLRDGYQHAVAPPAGFPQQRGPLHEVTHGPEAAHLEED